MRIGFYREFVGVIGTDGEVITTEPGDGSDPEACNDLMYVDVRTQRPATVLNKLGHFARYHGGPKRADHAFSRLKLEFVTPTADGVIITLRDTYAIADGSNECASIRIDHDKGGDVGREE